MHEKKGYIIVSLLFALAALIYTVFFETIVFDDSYDAFISNISSAQFTPFPLMDQHYLGVLLIRDLLKGLQVLLPQVNVFASAYILFNILSLALLIYSIQILLLKSKPALVKVLFALLVSMLFLENIISITHTRFSIIFCGLALIHLLYSESTSKYFWVFVFVFGFLMRPESGIGAIFIIGIGALLFYNSILNILMKWKFPILSVVFLSSVFLIHHKLTSRFEILIEPDIEYALSTNRLIPLSDMQNAEDSLRYQMAVNGMFIDEHFTDIAFLNRITQKQFAFNWSKFKASIEHVASFYSYYLFFAVFSLISLLLSKRALRSKMLSYFVLVFFILCYLDYNVTIADRHFIGVLLITILWPLLLVYKRASKGILLTSSYVILLIAAFYTLLTTLNNQRLIAKEVACIEENMLNFETVYFDRYVLIGAGSFHLLDRKYSLYDDKYRANKYLLYDAVNYSIVPRNMKYLSELCTCNASNPKEFVAWLAATNAILLMNEERAKIFQLYLNYASNAKFTLTIDPQFSELNSPACFQDLSVKSCSPWIVVVD